MRFKFIIKKSANFYYFLHNLAKCKYPFPYRKKALLEWKKKLGPFNQKEKDSLKIFEAICSKYYGKKHLGASFFLEKTPWSSLKREIPEKYFSCIKKLFSLWKKKFKKIYQKELPALEKWAKTLKSELKKPERRKLQKFFEKKIAILYRVSLPENTVIKIFLMLNPHPNRIGGERGRGLDGKSILLEVSSAPISKDNINRALAVMWHEIIQGCYSSRYFLPFLKKILPREKIAIWIEEIQIRSLLPIGLWGVKFFDYPFPLTLTPFKFEPIPKINPTQTIKIINLTQNYLHQNLSLDKKYIEKFIQILIKNKKWATVLKQ